MYNSDHEYCVYKHTSPSNKVYIGITGQPLVKRWQYGYGYKENIHFTNAIKKYKWKNFKHEVLFAGLSLDDAKKKEIELIALYDSTNRDKGYNKSPGGEMISEESKKKAKLTRDITGVTKRESERMRAKFADPEERRKQSERLKGLKRTLEQRKHISEALKGRKKSDEQKRKMSEIMKKRTGGNSIRKKAVCQINPVDGSIIATFPTARLAAASVGTSINSISSVCRGVDYKNQFKCGFYWCWADEYSTFVKTIELNREITPNGKLKKKPEENSFYGKHHSEETRKKWSGRNGVRVVCIETGDVYLSLSEAAGHYGSPTSGRSIRRQICGESKTAFGHTWELKEERT